MIAVPVSLGERAYDVCIGRDLLPSIATLAAARDALPRTVVIVYDAAVGEAAAAAIAAFSAAGTTVHDVRCDAGEGVKTLAFVEQMYARLARWQIGRADAIVAIGGGAIGDACGFIAATYLRGIRWIGVPTTLLAAVDSSVGGKTGINLAAGKNLVGAFHQPALVVTDVAVLDALPVRERLSGYGEMLKTALALDAPFWDELSRTEPAIDEAAIARCVRHKAALVVADEHDRLGLREVLNFGHTVGHAIETAAGYGHFRHGEAVLLGMRAAVTLSVARRHLKADAARAIDTRLRRYPVPTLQGVASGEIIGAVRNDKKANADGTTRFVLLSAPGVTISDATVDPAELAAAVEALYA